jgi:transcriptional regulator with XRE-family HTH domain
MSDLHSWIREQRKERGLSQADLATKIDLPSYKVSQWERGVVAPDEPELSRLEKVFGKRPTGIVVDGDHPAWWAEAIRLKDKMTLRELADHLGISVGMLTSEMKRAGVARRVRVSVPEPGERDSANRRNGSKDGNIEQFFHLLGRVPDSEVARLAEVSVRTVASYRSRNDINGYKGPRRRPAPRGRRESKLEDFKEMLGKLPDRVVADEAGMSLGAVRNYRIKHDIEPAGRMRKSEIARLLRELRVSQGYSEDEINAAGYDGDDDFDDESELPPEPTPVKRAPVVAAPPPPPPVKADPPVKRPVGRPRKHPLPVAPVAAPVVAAVETAVAAPVVVKASAPIAVSSDARAWRVGLQGAGGVSQVIVVARDLLSAVKRALQVVGGDDSRVASIEGLGKVIAAD